MGVEVGRGIAGWPGAVVSAGAVEGPGPAVAHDASTLIVTLSAAAVVGSAWQSFLVVVR